jgi:hypothetical protein
LRKHVDHLRAGVVVAIEELSLADVIDEVGVLAIADCVADCECAAPFFEILDAVNCSTVNAFSWISFRTWIS